MAHSNDMSTLVGKIERKLGLIPLTPHLTEEYNKNAWVNCIKEDTLPVFSRYFPNILKYPVNESTTTKKGKRYYLNDDYFGDAKILGISDIDWSDFGADNRSLSQVGPYGYYAPNYYGGSVSTIDQIIGRKLGADVASMFNTGIYIQYYDPAQFEVMGIGDLEINLSHFVVKVLIEHNNLSTISPTKMNVFEDLARADVATFLFKNLRYFDGLETVYAQIDLKLNELEQEADKREQIIEKLENSFVSASNDNIPYILTI